MKITNCENQFQINNSVLSDHCNPYKIVNRNQILKSNSQIRMIDRNPRASSSTAPKVRTFAPEQSTINRKQMIQPNSQNTQSENGFYDTLRVYTERLKQERDASLSYLKRINQLCEDSRKKDVQITRLNKNNRELIEKLSVYESVLTKSRVRPSPLRMSSVVDKHNMLESIIEYGTPEGTNPGEATGTRTSLGLERQRNSPTTASKFRPLLDQAREVKERFDLFEQFFIVSPGNEGELIYQYKHNNNNAKIEECIKLYVQHPEFVLKPYQGNAVKTGNKRLLFLADSPYTSMKKAIRPYIPLLLQVNPSYYYYGFCLIQKELMNVNGKYFWVPMVYGFLSYYPFPEHFLKTLEMVAKEFPNFKDPRVLEQSLNSMNATLNQIVVHGESSLKLPAEIKYTFFNHIQALMLPAIQEMSSMTLGYSKDIFKNYALELIIDVLMLLLLEIPITVISQDVELLGKFMLYFVGIIKPLKYPFPIVFSLPASMEVLFQSPFPTFIGCTDSTMVDKYMNERAVFDLDKKIAKSWPILEHLDSSRQYLMNYVMKNGGDIDQCSLVSQIIDGKNIKEIENYWKDFSRTQVYQLFACGE